MLYFGSFVRIHFNYWLCFAPYLCNNPNNIMQCAKIDTALSLSPHSVDITHTQCTMYAYRASAGNKQFTTYNCAMHKCTGCSTKINNVIFVKDSQKRSKRTPCLFCSYSSPFWFHIKKYIQGVTLNVGRYVIALI